MGNDPKKFWGVCGQKGHKPQQIIQFNPPPPQGGLSLTLVGSAQFSGPTTTIISSPLKKGTSN